MAREPGPRRESAAAGGGAAAQGGPASPADPTERAILAFEGFELDEARYELRRAGCRETGAPGPGTPGERIELAPRLFDVLRHLIRHRDRVVSKRELLDTVWQAEAVSESVLPTNVAKLRQLLGDDRREPRLIQTVHRRGYRFIASVTERAAGNAAPAAPGAGHPALAPAPTPGTAATAPLPLVGRDRLLAELSRALDAALAGQGRLVWLEGEPGIGKTRLAGALAERARARGARVLHGRAHEGEGAPAYWPFVQVLRALLAAAGGAEPSGAPGPRLPADLARLLAAAGVLDASLPAAVEPGEARFQLFDATASLLQGESMRQPLVLVLDDLHWADAPSLQLLRFLAGELPRAALLVVGTHRALGLGTQHPLSQLLGELVREPHCTRVALRGLEKGEVRTLLRAVAGRTDAPHDAQGEAGPHAAEAAAAPGPGGEGEGARDDGLDDALVDGVYAMTGGNPFFVTELARLLEAEGRLAGGAGGVGAAAGSAAGPGTAAASRAPGHALPLPQSVREAVGRRLAALSAPCQRVLGAASVLGRAFDLPILAHVAGEPAETLLPLLEEAVAARLVQQDPADAHPAQGFGFAHALIREALHEDLPAAHRAALHRKAAETLEAQEAEGGELPWARLAHHFLEAGTETDRARAADHAARAGAEARRVFAFEEAALHYGRALAALEAAVPRDEGRRCELQLARAEATRLAGDRASALEQLSEVWRLATHLGRVDLQARAALETAECEALERAQLRVLRERLETAIEALGEGEALLRAQLYAKLASEVAVHDAAGERAALAARAEALASGTDDPVVLYEALFARSDALHTPETLAERAAAQDAMLRAAERSGDRQRIFRARGERMRSRFALGEMEGMDAALAALEADAPAASQPLYAYELERFHIWVATVRGAFPEAQRRLARVAELARRIQDPGRDVSYWVQRVWVAYQRGELARDGVDLFPILDRLDWAPSLGHLVTLGRITLEAATQPLPEARSALRRLSPADLAAIPHNEHWLLLLGHYLEGCVRTGEHEGAEAAHALLLPHAEGHVVHELLRIWSAPVALVLGEAEAMLGAHAEAEAHLEAALATAQSMGARPAEARTRVDLARVLRARGRRGDAARAEAHAEAAARTAREIGLPGVEAALRAL